MESFHFLCVMRLWVIFKLHFFSLESYFVFSITPHLSKKQFNLFSDCGIPYQYVTILTVNLLRLRYKVLQAGGLKRQKLIFLQSWRLEIAIKMPAGLVSSEASPLGVDGCLPPPTPHRCLSCKFQSYWIGADPINDLILTLLAAKILSPNMVTF